MPASAMPATPPPRLVAHVFASRDKKHKLIAARSSMLRVPQPTRSPPAGTTILITLSHGTQQVSPASLSTQPTYRVRDDSLTQTPHPHPFFGRLATLAVWLACVASGSAAPSSLTATAGADVPNPSDKTTVRARPLCSPPSTLTGTLSTISFDLGLWPRVRLYSRPSLTVPEAETPSRGQSPAPQRATETAPAPESKMFPETQSPPLAPPKPETETET